MHSKEDRGVSPRNAEILYQQIRSPEKELRWIENSGHVLTMDQARGEVIEIILEFLHRITGQTPI
jgi:carboxylesterase